VPTTEVGYAVVKEGMPFY